MKVAEIESEVSVEANTPVSTDAASNANQQVISGKDLEALPDDPDELAAALQALAGPSIGPGGGQIFIDGFSGANMPPKESIREIRINQNPFAAENDQPSGRIDILTKPGHRQISRRRIFQLYRRKFELAESVRGQLEQAGAVSDSPFWRQRERPANREQDVFLFRHQPR